MTKWLIAAGVSAVLLAQPGSVRAETSELRLATQFGIGAMPMILMEKNKVLEKHLAAAGLKDVNVTWRQFPGGNPINEGLLAGSLDIASGGATVFITLWGKTKGTASAVRSAGSLSALPLLFLTRDPDVHRLQDLTDKDKIGVTTVKVSVHAILLQMAAAKIYGPDNFARFDAMTFGLPHGETAKALMSGAGEVNNHFSAPPFQNMELKAPGVRRVTSAQEILGSPATYMVAYATERFRSDNPRTFAAFVSALHEVHDYINNNPRAAAQDYLDQSKDKITVDEAVAIITDKESKFTTAPQNVVTFANFMNARGLIKVKPDSWKDMFFPEVQADAGS
jgi:NitT/TauT family transport system substrate-binding protein